MLELAVVKHRNLSLKKENDMSFHEWIPFWRNILVFGELDQVLENGVISGGMDQLLEQQISFFFK